MEQEYSEGHGVALAVLERELQRTQEQRDRLATLVETYNGLANEVVVLLDRILTHEARAANELQEVSDSNGLTE